MLTTIFYTFIGIPTGYLISVFINDFHYHLYRRNISNSSKYSIVSIITFSGFLKGYTGNDLMTNIYQCSQYENMKI
jgi:hypothetical protein